MDFAEACAVAKGGPKLKYLQDRIWRYLRKHPGVSSTEVAEAIKTTRNSAAHVLQRMRKAGFAQSAYLDHRRADRYIRWYAVGDKPPENKWGTARGSLDALRANWTNWEHGIKCANAAMGREYRPRDKAPPKVEDAHPLSAVWKMVPISAVDDEEVAT